MCLSSSSEEEIDIAFDGLTESYFNCKLKESDIVSFIALLEERNRRKEYEMMK